MPKILVYSRSNKSMRCPFLVLYKVGEVSLGRIECQEPHNQADEHEHQAGIDQPMPPLPLKIKPVPQYHVFPQGHHTGNRVLQRVVDQITAPTHLLVMVSIDELELSVMVDGLDEQIAGKQAGMREAQSVDHPE